MSSSRGHRSSGSSRRSEWSEWEWDHEHERYKRSRYNSGGELVWDWEKLPDENAATQLPADLDPIQEDNDPTSGITDSLQNTNLDTAQGTWYGTQSSTQYSTQYGTQYGKGKATAAASSFGTSPTDDTRTSRRSKTQAARKNRDLDANYKVHRSKDFKFGKIFRVFWSEPKGGNGGTEITDKGEGFNKVRPFMVIDNRRGHCLCLPILTYGGQGTLKSGAHPDDHTVIYSTKRSPGLFDGEMITKKSIQVDIRDPSNKLDPASRLNYAKVYTVEHNVKVYFIGEVAKKSQQQVVDDYRLVNPPLPDVPYFESSDMDDNAARYAEGYDTSYDAEGQNKQYHQDYQEDLQDYDEDPHVRNYQRDLDEDDSEGGNYTTKPRKSETPPYQEDPRTLPVDIAHPDAAHEEESTTQHPNFDHEAGEGSSTQRYQHQYSGLDYEASKGSSEQRYKHKRSGRH